MIPKLISSITEPICEISCGLTHTGAVSENGILWMMGGNSFGQLGLGNKKGSVIPVKITALEKLKIKKVSCGLHTAAITHTGDLYCWGTGVFGEVLIPQKVTAIKEKIVDISIGGSFGTAIDQTGKLWAWGANTSGELGVGDYDPRTGPIILEKLSTKPVTGISCGGSYAIALGLTHSNENIIQKTVPVIQESHFMQNPSNPLVSATSISNPIKPLTRNEQQKMESLISQVLSQSLSESVDSLYAPPIPQQNVPLNIEPKIPSNRQIIKNTAQTQIVTPTNAAPLIMEKNIKTQKFSQPIVILQESQPFDNHSISEANTMELISSVTQRDPHQPLLTVLTKQRDYLEESLEKERKERKQIEEELQKMKSEFTKLKAHSDQVEAEKNKEKSDLDNLLSTYTLNKNRIEELEPKVLEMENENRMLDIKLKEKESAILEMQKEKEDLNKKYTTVKNRLKGHNETETKLAKENENMMKKLKSLEQTTETELNELRAENSTLSQKIDSLESQNSGLIQEKLKLSEKLIESEKNLKDAQNLLTENTQKYEKEKSILQADLQKNSEIANMSQESLNILQHELESIKSEILQSETKSKQDLENAEKKLAEIQEENKTLKSKNDELNLLKMKGNEKINELDTELKETIGKLAQLKKINEELEERNYKLMDALHQDVSNRTKQYKGRTLVTQVQANIKENPTLTMESKGSEGKNQFSFREPSNKIKGVSPPQNLVVESGDDITLFDSLHKPTGAFILPENPKETSTGSAAPNIQNNKRLQSPSNLIPIEEPNLIIKSSEKKNPEEKPPKSKPKGIASKLQDFEQRLRDSLSKVGKK